MKLPALIEVPLHVDVEVLNGFKIPDTREGKLATIRLLGQRIFKSIPRSPIVGHLKKIYHDEIMALAPTMTLKEWDLIGYIYKANTFFISYYTMVKNLVEDGKLDKLDVMISNSRIRFPSILKRPYSDDYTRPSPAALIKIVEYLRDKPNRFRPLIKQINYETLPILLACEYAPEDLEMILTGGVEIDEINNFLNELKEVLKDDLSYLSDETVIFRQFQVLLPILRVIYESSPEAIKANINQIEVALRLRFNQPVDASEFSALEPSLASVILIRVKRYEEAIMMLPPSAEDLDLQNIISDSDFCHTLALMKGPTWIRSYFDTNRDLIWEDRSLIAAYFGIGSVETEFSTVIDETIRGSVPAMWNEMMPTLLAVGTKPDIQKYLENARNVPTRHVWIELFDSIDSLGLKRFKFCVLAMLEISRLIDNSVKIPFSAAKAIVEDAELFAAFADNEQPIRLQCDAYRFIKALKDEQNFNFMMTNMQQLSLIITNIGDISHECVSPLEIARAYALVGNGKTVEQFLAGLIKHEFQKSCGSNGENRDICYSDRIVGLFSHWRKVNRLRTIEGIPEDLEELERRVRETIRYQSLLKDSNYLSKFEKRSYFTLFLLKCDYFNDY